MEKIRVLDESLARLSHIVDGSSVPLQGILEASDQGKTAFEGKQIADLRGFCQDHGVFTLTDMLGHMRFGLRQQLLNKNFLPISFKDGSLHRSRLYVADSSESAYIQDDAITGDCLALTSVMQQATQAGLINNWEAKDFMLVSLSVFVEEPTFIYNNKGNVVIEQTNLRNWGHTYPVFRNSGHPQYGDASKFYSFLVQNRIGSARSHKDYRIGFVPLPNIPLAEIDDKKGFITRGTKPYKEETTGQFTTLTNIKFFVAEGGEVKAIVSAYRLNTKDGSIAAMHTLPQKDGATNIYFGGLIPVNYGQDMGVGFAQTVSGECSSLKGLGTFPDFRTLKFGESDFQKFEYPTAMKKSVQQTLEELQIILAKING